PRSPARWASPSRSSALDRGVEEGEPLAEVGLDRQVGLELRLPLQLLGAVERGLELVLQLQLVGVVALLFLARGDERPPRAGLEAVDPVDGMARARRGALEAEGRCEELTAEAVVLQLPERRMDG